MASTVNSLVSLSNEKVLETKMNNGEVIAKLLCSVNSKFDPITASIRQFQDLDSLSLDDVLATLKMHENKLRKGLLKRRRRHCLLEPKENLLRKKELPLEEEVVVEVEKKAETQPISQNLMKKQIRSLLNFLIFFVLIVKSLNIMPISAIFPSQKRL